MRYAVRNEDHEVVGAFDVLQHDGGWWYAIGDEATLIGPYGDEHQAYDHARVDAWACYRIA